MLVQLGVNCKNLTYSLEELKSRAWICGGIDNLFQIQFI